MTPVGALGALAVVGVLGVALVVQGVRQPRPSLERVLRHLRRGPTDAPAPGGGRATVIGSRLLPLLGRSGMPTRTQLRLVGRSPEAHAASLLAAALAGLLLPALVLGVAQATGVVSLRWFVPVGLSLVGAVLAPLVVHTDVVERARDEHAGLRHQLSAYLDVVTMLLAGNTGHEGALEQAAHAGDGRLFRELRRRMREVGATGRSLVEALDVVGADLGVVELEQVAATAALSAQEGAPVARTLAAKCATLRSTLATEQESEARLRTSRLTTPIVGMALVFMALVIYPALSVP